MQKRLTKSILSLILALALCLGIASALLCLPSHSAHAADVDSYYSSITATGGKQLLGQIHDLITSTHKTYTSYSDCKNPDYIVQTDPGSKSGTVMEFYSQIDLSSAWGSGDIGTWNREHVWCQSNSNGLWGESGGGSDLHHIRPSESGINSHRGNLKYGVVPHTSKNEAYVRNTNKVNTVLGGYKTGDTFEPLDIVKGDVARIVLYVYTHYNSYTNSSVFGNYAHTNGSNGKFGTLPITNNVDGTEKEALDMLVQWSKNDPVSNVERIRNEAVYNIQGNRNPFVDHPEYVDAIWGDEELKTEPLKGLSFEQSSLTLPVGQQTTLYVTRTPANAKLNLSWTSSNTAVATVADGVVTPVSAGTTTITATDTTTNISASINVTVKSVTGITISGTPQKLEYDEGECFDPAGLTVTAKYSDNTTEKVALNSCQWLDGTTGENTLSAGTTTVICKFGNYTETIEGITVNAYEGGGTEIININSFKNLSSGYKVQNWETDTICGIAFIYYANNINYLQFNSSQNGYYLASTTAAPAGIKSITVKLSKGSERSWELRTSNTAYSVPQGEYPTAGTPHGSKTVTTSGVTWQLDGTEKFFTLNYKDSGACYLDSIIIEYGSNGDDSDGADDNPPTPPTPQEATVSLNKTSLSLSVNETSTLVATTTGTGTLSWSSSNAGVATVSQSGVVTAVSAGTAVITASYGGKTATCTVTVTDNSTVEPDPDPVEPTPPDPVDPTPSTPEDKFVDAVTKVQQGGTQQDIRSAIGSALQQYHNLTAEQKQNPEVVAKYAELLAEIDNYNQKVTNQNNEMQLAMKAALQGFSGTAVAVTMSALALWAIKRRYF